MKFFIFSSLIVFMNMNSTMANCVAEMQKSTLLMMEGKTVVNQQEGYFSEYADIVKEKGYEVCVGSKCEGKNIDLTFKVVFSALIERKLFGWDKVDYFSAFITVINGNQSKNTYESDELDDAFETSFSLFKQRIPECPKN